MKIVKSISLFFVMAIILIGVGFFLGVKLNENRSGSNAYKAPLVENEVSGPIIKDLPLDLEARQVAEQQEKVNADTELIIMEKDVLQDTVVETATNMPDKFLGMTRENFEEAMAVYESAPPLSEKERGFQGLEIQSFSTEKVVIQMNYKYVQPGSSFYLGVANHEIIVFLDDKETVYIHTGIQLEDVAPELQLEIIALKYIENEESLYAFLENYSS